jgi:type IV fimbrial biogenesis protein FimT
MTNLGAKSPAQLRRSLPLVEARCYEFPKGGSCAGFSLIELMVTVAVLVLVVLVAAPSFDTMFLNSRLTAYSGDFVAATQTARSEAIKRNARVLLCASSNGTACDGTDWRQGWLVVHDVDGLGTFNSGDTVLLKHEALDSSYSLVSTPSSSTVMIVYDTTGAVSSAVTMKLSRTSPSATTWREIEILATGRVAARKCTSSGCTS